MKAVKRRYYLIFRLQRSILGPILLNVFINGLNDGWDEAHPQQICRWYKNRTGAWYTKWLNCCSGGCGEAGDLGSPEAEQRQKPNPALGEEETFGTHPCRLGSVWLESNFVEKASGILVDRTWKINQQHVLDAKVASSICAALGSASPAGWEWFFSAWPWHEHTWSTLSWSQLPITVALW